MADLATPQSDLTVPLGITDSGTLVTLNIADSNRGREGTGPHGFISGSSDSGAESLALSIAAAALRAQNGPDSCRLP